jgi:hypothetical protein
MCDLIAHSSLDHGLRKNQPTAIFTGMAQHNPYRWVEVESFVPDDTSGRHGLVHIRPAEGQGLSTGLFVECSKTLSRDYPGRALG